MDSSHFLKFQLLFHHPIVIKDPKEEGFDVIPEFVVSFCHDIGAYWVTLCPDGDVVKLFYSESSILVAKVHGAEWNDLINRFGLKEGQEIHFHYLGGQRFRLLIPTWDGYLYPDFKQVESASVDDGSQDDDGTENFDFDLSSSGRGEGESSEHRNKKLKVSSAVSIQ